MARQPGFTLIEAVVTIFILGTLTGIFATSIYVTRASRRASDIVAVDLYLSSVIDGLEHAYPDSLQLRTDGDAIGLAYNVGQAIVVEGTDPPSGTQVLGMPAVGVPLDSGLSSLALLAETYEDVEFSADLRVDPDSGADWESGLVFGYTDPENYHRVMLDADSLVLERVRDGIVGLLDTAPASVAAGDWFGLHVTVSGDQIDAELDGQPVLSSSDPFLTDGHAGIAAFGATTDIAVDDLTVTSPDGFVEDFEADTAGSTPDILLMNAPYGLADFRPSLTIAQYEDIPDLLEVTAKAEWTATGSAKERELNALLFIE